MVKYKKQFLMENLTLLLIFIITLPIVNINWHFALGFLIVAIAAHYLFFKKLKSDNKWFSPKKVPQNLFGKLLEIIWYLALNCIVIFQKSFYLFAFLFLLGMVGNCVQDYVYNFSRSSN